MKIKLQKKSLFPLVCLIFIMLAIFIFSAQNGSGSSRLSSSFSRLFCRLLFSGFNEMTAEQQLFLISGIHHFVRKAAHFCVYAALGFCSYSFFYFSGIRLKGIFPPAVMLCAAYAVIDEIHQFFTPGRSIKITDMLLDSVGAAFGAVIAAVAAIVILHIKSSIAEKKLKPEEVS